MNTANRLSETAVWFYCVINNVNALKPFGKAWQAILCVRLFHSRIRYKLNKQNDEIFSIEEYKYGIINQLHLIGTLLGTAYNPLYMCSEVLSLPVSNEEKENFLHLWKYIGYVLGIEYNEKTDPLKDYDTARTWTVKIFDKIVEPDCDKNEKSTTNMLSA
eukprot:50057_1